MKKYIVIFSLFLLIPLFGFSQTTIIMEESNGVYKIPCLINGAKMKMIFDTGASSVSLSKSIADYLLENDYITTDDFLGVERSVVADGTVVNNLHLNIKDIEISGLHLYNVEAVVLDSQTAPLLLGLSAINQLGRVELDGNKLTIISLDNDIDGSIQSYIDQAQQYRKDGLYSKAAEYYGKAHSLNGLSDFGKYQYSRCLMHTEQFTLAKSIVDSIEDLQWFIEKDINVYEQLGWVYENNNFIDEAIAYYRKAFDLQIPSNTYTDKAYYSACIGYLYHCKKWYDSAVSAYQIALYCLETEYGLRENYLYDDCMGKLKKGEKSYRNKDVDYYVFCLIEALESSGNWGYKDALWGKITLARNGNTHARKLLNKLGIPYDEY